MLKPEYTPRFDRDIKRLKRKHVDLAPLKAVINLILADTPEAIAELKRHHRLHRLKGAWSASLECPVDNTADWLLVWTTGNGLAVFQATGTHDEVLR